MVILNTMNMRKRNKKQDCQTDWGNAISYKTTCINSDNDGEREERRKYL